MTPRRQSEWTLHVATLLMVLGCVCVLHAAGDAPASGDQTLHVGPQLGAFIGGILVTVGINLQQLRQLRLDVRDLKNATNASLSDMRDAHKETDDRVRGIENDMRFIRTRRRDDRPDDRPQRLES